MNASRFDQIVKNRANQRAIARIDRFRKNISAALDELGINRPSSYYDGHLPQDIKGDLALVLANVASGLYFQPGVASQENPLKPAAWPRVLWEREREAVEKELMATMDEMQKALCAPAPSDGDPQPVPVE